MNTTRLITAFALFCGLLSVCRAQQSTPDPQTALSQAVAELQKNPADTALREKIIKLAAEMNPAPAMPEEAKRFMVRGATAFKAAKNPEDARDAVAEFEKATLAAPWLADAYNNLGVAQDKAGLYAEAIQSLKWYLLAAPNASDAEQKRTLIYEIEYRRDKAAKDAQLAAQKATDDARKAAQEARARVEEEARSRAEAQAKQKGLRSLVGNWYCTRHNHPGHTRLEMRGEELWFVDVTDRTRDWSSIRVGDESPYYVVTNLDGKRLIGRFSSPESHGYMKTLEVDDAFETITEHIAPIQREDLEGPCIKRRRN